MPASTVVAGTGAGAGENGGAGAVLHQVSARPVVDDRAGIRPRRPCGGRERERVAVKLDLGRVGRVVGQAG